MIDPDEEILRAILTLEGNPSWEILRKKWFRQSLSETKGYDEPIYLKGMQDQILDLMDKVDGARENLRIIEKRKPIK